MTRDRLLSLIAVLRADAEDAEREAREATGDLDYIDAHAEARALRKAAALIEGFCGEDAGGN